jgi:hypothetical protein
MVLRYDPDPPSVVVVSKKDDHVGDVKIVRTYDRGERLSERRRPPSGGPTPCLPHSRTAKPCPACAFRRATIRRYCRSVLQVR